MSTTVEDQNHSLSLSSAPAAGGADSIRAHSGGWWSVDNMGRAWSGVGQRIKQEDKIDGLLVAVEDSSFGYFKSNRLMVFHGF